MVSLTEISSREILTLFHLGSAGKNQEMSRALEEGGGLQACLVRSSCTESVWDLAFLHMGAMGTFT